MYLPTPDAAFARFGIDTRNGWYLAFGSRRLIVVDPDARENLRAALMANPRLHNVR